MPIAIVVLLMLRKAISVLRLKTIVKPIDLDPELTEVYNNRGVTYHHTGDFGAAIEDYNKAINLDPEDARTYTNRGLAYTAKSDFGAAIEDHNKAIDLDPENALVYANRGSCL